MGRIPQALRETIARNIRNCRLTKYPGRGGGKQCAEAFSRYIGKNISPQQWSPWERGMRTPDETRLEQIAAFFGKTVEYMRRDTRPPVSGAPSGFPSEHARADDAPQREPYTAMSIPELLMAMGRDRVTAVYQIEISVSPPRFIAETERRR